MATTLERPILSLRATSIGVSSCVLIRWLHALDSTATPQNARARARRLGEGSAKVELLRAEQLHHAVHVEQLVPDVAVRLSYDPSATKGLRMEERRCHGRTYG